MSGSRITCRRIGRRIAMGIGATWDLGAGPGSITSLGASRLSTTDAGDFMAALGAGARGRFGRLPVTAQRLSASSVGVLVSDLVLASAVAGAMPGSLWAGVSRTVRGITAGRIIGTT